MTTLAQFAPTDWRAYYTDCAHNADRQAARAMRLRRPQVAREWRKLAAELRSSADRYGSWPT